MSDPGLEARPTSATSAPVSGAVGSERTFPAPQSAPALLAEDVVVPDYPPQEDLLPPAPTSPAVHTVPFDRALAAPAPVSPIDAAPRAPLTPAVPVVGQPRFSVPGLEHVVVEGTEPEPVGPIGYRTPARFAHQRPAAGTLASSAPVSGAPVSSAPAPTSVPTRSFDAVIAPPAPATTAAPTSAPTSAPAPGHVTNPATTQNTAGRATATVTAPPTGASGPAGAEPRLQAGPDTTDTAAPDATDGPARRPAVGATPGALLGAVAGLATLGLAAWWFTAPATVHGVGLALGVIALLLSIVTLRNAATTWQRPIALLGAVLGGVGMLGLLWAVAAALLPMAGVTLPDLTGTGTTPTLAP
ncbi:hypothetical protein DEJ28_06990 [Curtobacterium sp. MCPF17_002]|uniref:hypothetical protein n=1 Tax=Curtobacterium sp. MCPF17_002 TaxID=2175645 RepID=UPI000DA77B15|nr:hypothetical protein [Curtobacterium sp. MCPF17_002]WIB78837.1 hypothetical protein DEJ28_06990 [Curtobacterium sp. MCPF17_002]